MRRFVTLAFLLFFTIPFGVSIAGCSKSAPAAYCNGADSGPQVGQLFAIALQPQLYGISLNYAETGQVSSPSATDCKGTAVSSSTYTYGTTDMTVADVVPSSGRLCAGTWNRNSGGGIADYTTCNPTYKSGTAYITASAGGATSNPIAIYIHPVVTSVVLGAPSTDCINDPATNCSINPVTKQCTLTTTAGNTAPPYTGLACLSQGQTAQLAARVYSGTGTPFTGLTVFGSNVVTSVSSTAGLAVGDGISSTAFPTGTAITAVGTSTVTMSANAIATNVTPVAFNQQNISCIAGNLTYTPQDTNVVTIDQNGIATAQAPGSTVIGSNTSNASGAAGFFATCPPQSITLAAPGNGGSTNIVVNQNFAQPITATVIDTNGNLLNNISLTFESTTPTTLPSGGAGSITPSLPGAGAIVAVCQPPTCNESPINQIGLFGNGKPVVSNAIDITTPGTSSTVVYIASTQSQYVVPVDFTSPNPYATQPVRLPYAPNSMVISVDGSNIYMGASNELMVFNALTNALSREDTSVSGTVLAISPDGNTLVMTDPIRQLVYLYNATSGGVQTSVGGVGTHAAWSPDSSTVYITAGNELLVHSTFTGWTTITGATLPPLTTPATDVAVTVPNAGAFFAGATTTGRGACPATTVVSSGGNTTTTNVFYPDAGVTGPLTDRLITTNDGNHVVGVTATPSATLTDLHITTLNSSNPSAPGQCPTNGTALQFSTTPVVLSKALPGITATSITGVIPSSDSADVFVTYAGTGGTLPLYMPATSGPGTLSSVTLSTFGTTAPVAPVVGAFSSDNTTFYVGTTGDNLVHILTKSGTGFVDKKAISPALPGITSGIAAPNLLVQRPRKIT